MTKLKTLSSILFAASMIVVTGTASAQTYTATAHSVDEAISAVKEKASKDGTDVKITSVMSEGKNFVKATAEKK